MIQTNEYALNPKEYLKILLRLQLRKSWWVYLLLIINAVVLAPRFGTDQFATFMFVLSILYIFFMFFYLVWFTKAKDNRNIYSSRQLNFGPEKIVAYSGGTTLFDTPTTSEVANSQVVRTAKVGNFWLLYLSRAQFIVVPRSIFKSAEDYEAFKKLFHLK